MQNLPLVFIVDEDAACRDFVSDLAKSKGFLTTTAEDGFSALGMLNRSSQGPSLFMIAYSMSLMNGFELVRELRRKEGTKKTPIIMLTVDHKQIKEPLEFEGVSYLDKSSAIREILDHIYRVLEKPRPENMAESYLLKESLASHTVSKPLPPVPPAPPRMPSIIEPASFALNLPAFPKPPKSFTPSLVDNILDSAVERRASDIHIEPAEHDIVVRIRVDGALQPLVRLPANLRAPLTARIKVLCDLDITERRLPQDGHLDRLDSSKHKVRFRVSTLPSLYGEKIVLRILRSGKLRFRLENLNLSKRNHDIIHATLQSSSGLILLTGPTGSGKTTTLYGMLDILNTSNRNIVTAEDPVEYELPGATQVQVNSEIGYTFERVLRAFLRQDPNVMLVGEMRDSETAAIGLKAAVTGHMVLSSVHTNDAPSTLQRLVSMGIPAYLVAAACRLVIAQRLLRLLCVKCKYESFLTEGEAAALTSEERKNLTKVWRAQGCPACHGTGTVGRQAILEVMPVVSHAIRQAIVDQCNPQQLRAIASSEGMVSLRQEALSLVAKGLTAMDEALSVLFAA